MIKEFKLLKQILSSERCPHAFLFYGPNDIGKYETAINIAKFLNCLDKKDNNFCDKCDQCRAINNLSHSDLFIVKKDDKKKEIIEAQIGDSKTEGSLIFNLRNSRLSGNYKICIIKDVDYLNKFAANNLLKILEEPPEKTIFILTTSNLKNLLDTIKSRCSIINFSLLNKDEIFDLLESKNEISYILSSNKYKKTLELKNKEYLDKIISDIKIFLNILKKNESEKILYIKKILEEKDNLNYYIYIWESAIKILINIDTNEELKNIFGEYKIDKKKIAIKIKKLYNIKEAQKGNYIIKIYLNEFILNL